MTERQVRLADRRGPEERQRPGLIRVAFYVTQVSEAVDMIKDAAEKGYEVSANLMAVTTVKEQGIDQALEVLAETPVSTLVVVDSYGAMYAEQVEILVKKYASYGKATGKEVGIHAHNNQQLAFANTIEAIIHGANHMDASMGGLGHGAGNCPMACWSASCGTRNSRFAPSTSASRSTSCR